MLYLKLAVIISLCCLTNVLTNALMLTQLRDLSPTHGCNQCALYGNCEHAYRNGSGQLCSTLQNNKPCCCPLDAECVVGRTDKCICTKKYNDNECYAVYLFVGACIFVIMIGVILYIHDRYRGNNGIYYGYNRYGRYGRYGDSYMITDTGNMGNTYGSTFSANTTFSGNTLFSSNTTFSDNITFEGDVGDSEFDGDTSGVNDLDQ